MSTNISISNKDYCNRLNDMKKFLMNRHEVERKMKLGKFIDFSYISNDAANRKYLTYLYLLSSDFVPISDHKTSRFYNRPQDIIDRWIESNLCLAILTETGDCKVCIRFNDKDYPIIPLKDYVRYYEFAMKNHVIDPNSFINIHNIDENIRDTSLVLICNRTLKYPGKIYNSTGFIKDSSPLIDNETVKTIINKIEIIRRPILEYSDVRR